MGRISRSLAATLFAASFASLVGCGHAASQGMAPSPTPNPGPPGPTPNPGVTSFSFIDVSALPDSTPATELPLWGIRGDNSPELVKEMVFGDNAGPSNPGLHSMSRLSGDATIVYNPSLAADKVAILRSAAAALQNVTGYQVTVGTNPVPGTATMSVAFGSTINENGAMFSPVRDVVGNITGGVLTFLGPEYVTDYTARHELGHGFGLDHHNGKGVMSKTMVFGSDGVLTYSSAEVDNMRMMLRVASGTTFPGMAMKSSSRR